MANYIYNSLYVRGPQSDIAAFRKQAEKPLRSQIPAVKRGVKPEPPTPISLERFVRLKPTKRDKQRASSSRRSGCGFSADYYAMARQWGSCGEAMYPVLVKATANRLRYAFNTGWTPPDFWLRTVSRMYPGLSFSLYHTGNDDRGWVRFKKGKPVSVRKRKRRR